MNNSISNVDVNESLGRVDTDAASVINDSFADRIKRVTSISQVLRVFGACAVISSLLLFIFEDWTQGNDLNRYFKLLGQTGLLTGAGLAMSFVIKEFKGARIFFGLGLVSAIANFTILGALIYSLVPLDGLLIDYPKSMTWVVSSSSQFLLVCISAIALLTLIARFSYAIFARKVAMPLTLSFLALNALLLIPLRNSLAVSVLTLVAVLGASSIVRILKRRHNLVLTPENKFAFATLFLPALIIVGRATRLYHVDEVLFLTLSGLLYCAIKLFNARKEVVSIKSTNKNTVTALLAAVQYALGVIIAVLVTVLLPRWLDDFTVVSFSLIFLALTYDQLKQGCFERASSLRLNVTVIMLVVLNVLYAMASGLLVIKLASFAMCLVILFVTKITSSFVKRTNTAHMTGLIGAVITLFMIILKLLTWVNLSDWMTIGLIGMTLIILGSSYERIGLKLPFLRTVTSPSSSFDNEGATIK